MLADVLFPNTDSKNVLVKVYENEKKNEKLKVARHFPWTCSCQYLLRYFLIFNLTGQFLRIKFVNTSTGSDSK
jgi:hypothetical protein